MTGLILPPWAPGVGVSGVAAHNLSQRLQVGFRGRMASSPVLLALYSRPAKVSEECQPPGSCSPGAVRLRLSRSVRTLSRRRVVLVVCAWSGALETVACSPLRVLPVSRLLCSVVLTTRTKRYPLCKRRLRDAPKACWQPPSPPLKAGVIGHNRAENFFKLLRSTLYDLRKARRLAGQEPGGCWLRRRMRGWEG